MLVALLHALPFDARMWSADDRQVAERTISPNLFTMGDSIEQWAMAIVDMAGTEELIVVGCSVGGSCALEVACTAPEQVRGIVLIGAKASVRLDPQMRDSAIRTLETNGLVAGWETYWAPLFGRNTPPNVLAAARALALGARREFHLVEDSGHYVNIEQPERFRLILSAVLSTIISQ